MMIKVTLTGALFLIAQLTTAQLLTEPLPDLVIGRGGDFQSIDLSGYTEAPEAIFWEMEFLSPGTPDSRPDWELAPSDFQFEMNVTAKVVSRGKDAVGSDHLLAVIDAEGNVQAVSSAIEVEGTWLYFLTVYSNQNGEMLYYRFFDDNFNELLNGDRQLTFVPNSVEGQPDNPIELQMARVEAQLSGSILDLSLVDSTFLGTERLVVTARLLEHPDERESDTVSLTVADNYTPLLSGISNQTIRFDETFASFDLDAYTELLDSDPVVFSASGNEDIVVGISAENVVSLTKPEGWFGKETIVFTVTDETAHGFFSEQQVSFTGKPQDQRPEILGIPDQVTGLQGSFERINLNKLVVTQNPESTVWTYAIVTDSVIAKPDWDVNEKDFQFDMSVTASVEALGIEAEGPDHMMAAFSQTDSVLLGVASPLQVEGSWYFFLTINNNNSTDSIFFKVFDARSTRVLPVLETLKFVSNEVIGDPLEPFEASAGYLFVEIRESDEAFISIHPSDWVGVEKVLFTATDTSTVTQLADADTVSFEIVNLVPPVLGEIPDQVILEGGNFSSVDLSDYLQNLSNDEVTWAITGGDTLAPALAGNMLSFTIPDEHFFGQVTMEVRASSNLTTKLSDVEEVSLVVVNVNDPPEITSQPTRFASFGELYSYEVRVLDIDDSNLNFAISDLPEWLFFVPGTASAQLIGIPGEGDAGEYEISISIDDGQETVNQLFTITVQDKYARFYPINPQSIMEGDSFAMLDLPQFLETEGSLEIFWEVVAGEHLTATVGSDTVLQVTPNDENWFGQEIVQLYLRSQVDSSIWDQIDVIFEVINVNDPPDFLIEPALVVQAGEDYQSVLRVEDVDHDSLHFNIQIVPEWLNLVQEGNALVLYGMPEAADYGANHVKLSVSDGKVTIGKDFEIMVGVALSVEMIQKELLLFPNPVDDWLTIKTQTLTLFEWRCYDQQGKLVLSGNPTVTGQLNLTALTSGIYLFEFIDTQKRTWLSRIVKK